MNTASPVIDLQIAHLHELNPSEAQFQWWITQAVNTLPTIELPSPPHAFDLLSTEQPIELCIRLVDHSEMQQLNHEFRDQNKPTNVLAFPFDTPPLTHLWQPETQLLGDIIICSPVVATEAVQQDKRVEHHWAHLTLHGFLHLLGYDHMDDADADLMEALEIQLLASMNIPNPYQLPETNRR
jgi:probable rRNA maturation factor